MIDFASDWEKEITFVSIATKMTTDRQALHRALILVSPHTKRIAKFYWDAHKEVERQWVNQLTLDIPPDEKKLEDLTKASKMVVEAVRQGAVGFD